VGSYGVTSKGREIWVVYKRHNNSPRTAGAMRKRNLKIYHKHTAVTIFFVQQYKLDSLIIEAPGFGDKHRHNLIFQRIINVLGRLNDEQQHPWSASSCDA
jgi:hypothetical protein